MTFKPMLAVPTAPAPPRGRNLSATNAAGTRTHNGSDGGKVTGRVPKVLANWRAAAGVAVILMGSGTAAGSPELRAWALLFGVLAAGMCAAAAIRDGVEAGKSPLSRCGFKVFEDG